MTIEQKMLSRIETNEEYIDNFSLSKLHRESIESENKFLNEILRDLYEEEFNRAVEKELDVDADDYHVEFWKRVKYFKIGDELSPIERYVEGHVYNEEFLLK